MKKAILITLSFLFFASASALRAENAGVPAECEDVMLQAFYWDSLQDAVVHRLQVRSYQVDRPHEGYGGYQCQLRRGMVPAQRRSYG